EHYDGVYLARVSVNVVDLDAVITARCPTLELLRICNDAQFGGASRENFLRRSFAVISSLRIAGDQQHAIAGGGTDFIAINEQNGTVVALQCHLGSVEVRR